MQFNLHIDFSKHAKSDKKKSASKNHTFHFNAKKNSKSKTRKFNLGSITLGAIFIVFIFFIWNTNTVHSNLSHKYTEVSNPNKFDTNCYINEEYYSTYEKEDIQIAAKHLYKKTGIQYYDIYIDIRNTECQTEAEADAYIKTSLDNYVKNPEYALIHLRSSSRNAGKDKEGYDIHIGYRNEYIVGEKTEEFLDSEALKYLRELYEITGSEWDSEKLYDCFDKFCDATLNYEKHQNANIFRIIIVSVAGIAIVVGILAIIISKKRHEETIRILNTPIDTLEKESEELKDKYLDI